MLKLLIATSLASVLVLSGCSRKGAEAEAGDGARVELPEQAMGRTSEYDYDPPVPGTYRLPRIRTAAGGRILGPGGRRRDLGELLDGRITILSFVYTRCADPRACPYATGVLSDVHRISEQDPVLAKNLQLLTFSFDPEHDTPQVMQDYAENLRTEGLGADWFFLTTEGPEELAPILDGYGQVVDAKKNANDPLGPYYHTLRVYLIDPNRAVRNIYSFGMLDPRLLLADVRTLLLERNSAAVR